MSSFTRKDAELRRGLSGSWVPSTRKQEEMERRLKGQLGKDGGLRLLRPHLNWDFADQSHYPYLPGPRIHVEPLVQQERQLVEDILNSFLGFSGYYVEPSALDDPKGERRFNISPHISTQLRTMAERILPLSSYYSRVVRFIQDNHTLQAGRVNQALSGYLDLEMQPFVQMVSKLEDRLVTKGLNLTTMWAELQEHMTKLQTLHQIVVCVSETTGGLTLTALHETIATTTANQEAQDLFCRAVKAASVPFFESLSKWVYSGIVFDPFDEFMIIEKTKKRNPSNWDNIFTIDYNYVPSFLGKVVRYIHSAGKYLDAIRNSLSFLDEMPQTECVPIVYDYSDPSYLTRIMSAYDFANLKLLEILVVHRDIIGRLRTAKAFFSLEHGDLFNNILDNCMSELKRPVSELCQSYLPSLLISAILTSSMKSLKYSTEVTVHLEKRSLLKQTLSMADPLHPVKDADDKELLGIDALTLKTTTKWPDCLIMHDKATRCYQMLFRHLFNVKLIHLRVAETHMMSLTPEQCMLKHCMLTFTTSILSYMTQDTIQENWAEFQAKASKANTVEQLRTFHDDFLYKSLTNCMLTSAVLHTKFRRALDVCKAFADDLSVTHAADFYEAVTDLINATTAAKLPGIEGFTTLIQPTYEHSSSQSISFGDSSGFGDTSASEISEITPVSVGHLDENKPQ